MQPWDGRCIRLSLLLPLCACDPPLLRNQNLCVKSGYVTSELALPCTPRKSWRRTSSVSDVSASPCGTGAGGEGGDGVLGLRRLGAGGVEG